MEPAGNETKSVSDAYSNPNREVNATAEQMLAVEALRASESRFRMLFENNVAAVICNTLDGRIFDCNNAAARILGYGSSQEMLDLNIKDIYWESETRTDLMARLQAEQSLAGIELKVRHKTGRPVWILANLNMTIAEQPSGVFVQGTLIDITERRQAEEALRQGETTLREALLAARMGVWEWTEATDNVVWDEGLYRTAGLDPKLLNTASSAYEQVIAPVSWERLKAAAGTAFATGTHFELDLELVRPDGSRRILIARGKPLRDAAGHITKLRGTVQDITERKHAEEALRQSEERYRCLFDQMLVGFALVEIINDENGKPCDYVNLELNPAFESQTGIPLERIRGRRIREVFPEIESFWIETYGKVAATGESIHFENYAEPLERWFEVTAFRVGPGRVGVSFADITERKRTEEGMRSSDQRYKDFIAHSTEGVWRVELAEPIPIDLPPEEAVERLLQLGYFAESNEAHARIRRFASAEEVIGKRLGELNPQADERKSTYLELAKRGYRSGSVEYWGLDINGNFRLLLRTDIPIIKNGKLVRIWGITRDITDLRRAEEERERSFKQLRALAGRLQNIREEERKRVAREIHDQLGQALTAIKIDLSSLLRELPAADKPQAKKTSAILKLVDESIRTVRRISTELRPGMLDDLGLVATLEWAGEDFQARTGTACRLDLPRNDIAVNPEQATAIFRIFQETLTNVARHANATAVEVRMVKDAGGLTLEVRDNGKGIPVERLTATKSLGILGMRERAMLLGGELTIKGTPGSGTTVKVRIPEAKHTRREPHHDQHPDRR